jgi:hypothetical protein
MASSTMSSPAPRAPRERWPVRCARAQNGSARAGWRRAFGALRRPARLGVQRQQRAAARVRLAVGRHSRVVHLARALRQRRALRTRCVMAAPPPRAVWRAARPLAPECARAAASPHHRRHPPRLQHRTGNAAGRAGRACRTPAQPTHSGRGLPRASLLARADGPGAAKFRLFACCAPAPSRCRDRLPRCSLRRRRSRAGARLRRWRSRKSRRRAAWPSCVAAVAPLPPTARPSRRWRPLGSM